MIPEAKQDRENGSRRSNNHGSETTAALIEQARGGHERSRARLVARYVGVLRRWAHGRVPPGAHGWLDSEDLVQATLCRTIIHLDFEFRGEAAFLSYLRQVLLNQIRDHARRAARRPEVEALSADLPGREPSPLERVIALEKTEQYEHGLSILTPLQREAVILRFERGCRYLEIAQTIGLPSANAARALVARGLVGLSKVLRP